MMIDFSKPKHLFLAGLGYSVFLFALLAVTGFFPESDLVFGVSKTIGFAYDFVIAAAVYVIASQIIAVIGYGFLWMFGCRVNTKLSVLHCSIIIIMPFILYFKNKDGSYTPAITAALFTVVIAAANAVFAMYYKMYDKKKRLDN